MLRLGQLLCFPLLYGQQFRLGHAARLRLLIGQPALCRLGSTARRFKGCGLLRSSRFGLHARLPGGQLRFKVVVVLLCGFGLLRQRGSTLCRRLFQHALGLAARHCRSSSLAFRSGLLRGQGGRLLLQGGKPRRLFSRRSIRGSLLPGASHRHGKGFGFHCAAPERGSLCFSPRLLQFTAALVFGIFRGEARRCSSLRFGLGTGSQLFRLELQCEFTVTRGSSLLQRPLSFHTRLRSFHGGLLGGNFQRSGAARGLVVLLRLLRTLTSLLFGLCFGSRTPGGGIHSRPALGIQRRSFGGRLRLGLCAGFTGHGGRNIGFTAPLFGFALQGQFTRLVLRSRCSLLLGCSQCFSEIDRFLLGGNTQGGLPALGLFSLLTLHSSQPRCIECFGMCACRGQRFRFDGSADQGCLFRALCLSRYFKLLFFNGFLFRLRGSITPCLRCGGLEQTARACILSGVFPDTAQTLARGIAQLIKQPAQRSRYVGRMYICGGLYESRRCSLNQRRSCCQRSSAESSLERASTQRAPLGVTSFFQNGAWVFR